MYFRYVKNKNIKRLQMQVLIERKIDASYSQGSATCQRLQKSRSENTNALKHFKVDPVLRIDANFQNKI